MEHLLEMIEVGRAIELTKEQYSNLPEGFTERWKTASRLNKHTTYLNVIIMESRYFLVLYDCKLMPLALRRYSEDLKHFVNSFTPTEKDAIATAPDEEGLAEKVNTLRLLLDGSAIGLSNEMTIKKKIMQLVDKM
ncbi:MAG: hypothetical protein ACRBFS_10535 [Aureispira sp.]